MNFKRVIGLHNDIYNNITHASSNGVAHRLKQQYFEHHNMQNYGSRRYFYVATTYDL